MVDTVVEFLSDYPEEIRAISGELRDMARNAMPGAHEFLYYDAINYSLSNSPLERICYISPTQKHVTLGFLFGTQLDDQHRLLQGIGKRARHVKVGTLEEARNPALKEMVKAAWAHGADSLPEKKRSTRQRGTLVRQPAVARSRTKRAPRSRRRRRTQRR